MDGLCTRGILVTNRFTLQPIETHAVVTKLRDRNETEPIRVKPVACSCLDPHARGLAGHRDEAD
jgi:hypothetical protein